MKLRFWGVRGSTPTPVAENFRYGGNTSCVEVRSPKGEIIILDCGTGFRSLGKQLLQEYGHRSIEAYVFLSHYHWDHIQGIPFFEPLYNPENCFYFHSFPGHRCTVQQALEEQMSDPYFPVNMSVMEARRQFHNIENETISFKDAVLKTVPLNHPQGCVGFRIESGGSVIVYATDNEPGSAQHDSNVRRLAEGADVLIYDAQYTPLEYVNFKKGWGHSTWREAVNIAKEAQVKQLVLFHHDPDHSDNFLETIVGEAQKFFPNVVAAWEGLEIDISRKEHLHPPDQAERRASNRESFKIPLLVQGKGKDGIPFVEHTTLENLSIRGAYFLLENDPAPDDLLDVEFLGRTNAPDGSPASKLLRPIKSQLIRKYPVELPDKTKHGIAVVFR
ncbi:MAG: MBL fold metallo-hydrolase [Acidobacteria bacterium]|nr:MBL fold metallo-hydrolase [Acidobacteriota bacterium]